MKIFRIFTALVIVKILLLSVPIAEFAMATECSVDQASKQKASTAFRKVLSVLRHPRCANCHGAINVYDEATTHPGGVMVDVTEDIFGDKVIIPKKAAICVMCHDEGNGLWIQKTIPTSEIQWANLSDRELWMRLQKTRITVDPENKDTRPSTGALLIDHVGNDHLIDLAFQGKRGMGTDSYYGVPEADPPPLTKAQFLVALKDWVEAMDASASWPEGDCSIALEEPAAQDLPTATLNLANYSGSWVCPIRGYIKFEQASNGQITGSFGGKEGEHWHQTLTGGGTLFGSVTGNTFSITMQNGDGSTSDADAEMSSDGNSFSGDWHWKKDGQNLGSGHWDCHR